MKGDISLPLGWHYRERLVNIIRGGRPVSIMRDMKPLVDLFGSKRDGEYDREQTRNH